MSDEEVIRRRLLIDGDGTGDDRRLNALLKTMIKWANSTDDTATESQMVYDRMLSQLSQCEFAVKRSLLLQKTNQRELDNYKKLQHELEKKIANVKNTIEVNKVDLQQAKVLKQNRMMYDLLAQSIQEQPARRDTDKKLANLKSELNDLREEKQLLEQKLDMRRKQFHVLISSCNQLQSMSNDTREDDAMNTSLDDITNSPGPEVMSE
ncbi:maintenance of killer 16 mak16 protein-related [Holotrichia oblita]|uniref:Maintenance of killer 16 mak16 protein-related n=1 Tax=Holotrichia oblita TaxID=644536 RepID=A0ACB9SW10_HOLOL|nr:maintenance of killer 16 mak16 protein-related [Holotrichia oblita]